MFEEPFDGLFFRFVFEIAIDDGHNFEHLVNRAGLDTDVKHFEHQADEIALFDVEFGGGLELEDQVVNDDKTVIDSVGR